MQGKLESYQKQLESILQEDQKLRTNTLKHLKD